MKTGVVLPVWRLSVPEMISIGIAAEELGFDGVFVPDHILAKPATMEMYGPTWPDPFSMLAYLAGRTTSINLGTSAVILPYRHPLVTAKAVATVDQVSEGRFIFGVGVGWDEAEFDDLGLSFSGRGPRSDEYLGLMKAAWRDDTLTFDGTEFRVSEAAFSPRPVQLPHPPIWGGGAPATLSAPALRRTATACNSWHPYWLDWDGLELGIARVRELAAEAGRTDTVDLAPRNLLDLTDDPVGHGRVAFQGSADELSADLRRAAELGCTWVTFDLPPGDLESTLQLMKRFTEEVAPAELVG